MIMRRMVTITIIRTITMIRIVPTIRSPPITIVTTITMRQGADERAEAAGEAPAAELQSDTAAAEAVEADAREATIEHARDERNEP